MAQFRINYNKVISQANSMNDLSRDLDSEIKSLESLLLRVKSEWIGPASSAFQNQLVILIADMKSTRFKMSSVSSTIKNTATRIQNEDEAIANKANILN